MMTAKEIRILMVENYNVAETISYKTKKKLQNGLCRILNANHLQQNILLMKLAICHGHLIIKAVSNKKNVSSKNYDSKELASKIYNSRNY